MNNEESKLLADYILSVISTLKTERVAIQKIGEYNYDIGYYESDDDEFISELIIGNTKDVITKFHFSLDKKEFILMNDVDKDDYFNSSLKYDFLLNYEDIRRVFIAFSNIKDVYHIKIPHNVFKLITQGKLHEHRTVLAE